MATQEATYLNQTGFAPEIAPYGQNLLGMAAASIYDYQMEDKKDANGNPVLDPDGKPIQVPVVDAKGMPVIAGLKEVPQYEGDRQAQFTDLQKQAFAGAKDLGVNAASQASATGLEGLATKMQDLKYDPTKATNEFTAPGTLGYTATKADAAKVAAPKDVGTTKINEATTKAAQAKGIAALTANQMGAADQVKSNAVTADEIKAAQMGATKQVTSDAITAEQIKAAQMGPADKVASNAVTAAQIKAAQMGPAEKVSAESFAKPGTADAYMSPYIQGVIEKQQREAQRSADIAGTQRSAKAVGAGAFGGSRQAIENAEAARNLQTQMGDIQATGLQNAYQQAQAQFNAEQNAKLSAQTANQQAGLTVGTQNLTAQQQAEVQNAANQLQASGMTSQQAMQAALANQQAGLTVGTQNLSAQQQTSVQNAANALQAKGMSADSAMKAALANQQSELTVGQQNLTAQQQTAVQNAANKLQASGMNADQAMKAALANQQANLNVGQQNLAAKQGTQQLQATTDVQTQLANLNAEQQANVQNASQQFQASGMNADQAMKAALANQSTALTTGTQNASMEQQANLANANAANAAAQFGAGQGLTAAQTEAQYGQAANQLSEQSKQFGAGQGLAALQAAGQTNAALGAQGQNIYNQGVNNLGIQNTMGTQQQQGVQNLLTQQYTDFQNEVNAPYKQLGFMSDVVRGAPTSVQGTTVSTPAPSLLNQVAGAATTMYGLGQPATKARGGAIKQKKINGLPALLINSMARG